MRFVAAFSFVVAVASAFAADPAALLGQGRQYIQNRQFDTAVKVLQEGIDTAATLPEPSRTQALAALHFYAAVAYSGMNDEAKTRDQLEQFFRYKPETTAVDPAKYDKKFVERFQRERAAIDSRASSRFEAEYPGFQTFPADVDAQRPLEDWAEGPAMALLASSEERQQWKKLATDDQRRHFIDAFWQTRGEAYRREFERRVAFADKTFGSGKQHGSVTDRGRVFILLGPPKVVRKSNLTAEDAGRIARPPVGSSLPPPTLEGQMERWVYGKDQLPKTIVDDQLVFKFVTELQEYGVGVLQRDAKVVKAMYDAAHQPQ